MQQDTRQRKGRDCPAYLDPQMMSKALIMSDKQAVVRYLVRGMRYYADREWLFVPYNTGGHWVLINICTKDEITWFFDSSRPRDPDTGAPLARDYSAVIDVIDE